MNLKKIKHLSLITLCLSFSLSLCSQDYDPKINMLELNICGVKPLSTFGENINRDAMIGLELRYLRQIKSTSPLFWGIQYLWSPYASASATILEQIDLVFRDFDYRTYANMQGIHGFVRFYTPFSFWKVEPYVEGFLGGKWMFSGTTKTLSDDEESSSFFTEKSNLTLGIGSALGASIVLSDEIYLNLRASYMGGLQSAYLAPNYEDIVSSSVDAFSTKRGPTNMIIYSIGITGAFQH